MKITIAVVGGLAIMPYLLYLCDIYEGEDLVKKAFVLGFFFTIALFVLALVK